MIAWHVAYRTDFKYHYNLYILTFVIMIGNNTLHCVTAVVTVVIAVFLKKNDRQYETSLQCMLATVHVCPQHAVAWGLAIVAPLVLHVLVNPCCAALQHDFSNAGIADDSWAWVLQV